MTRTNLKKIYSQQKHTIRIIFHKDKSSHTEELGESYLPRFFEQMLKYVINYLINKEYNLDTREDQST